jgi:diguanylate cyclase (GGDEF)-like protein
MLDKLMVSPRTIDALEGSHPYTGPVSTSAGQSNASRPVETEALAHVPQASSIESDGPFAVPTSALVMMVDDEPLMLEIVQAFLEEAGYRRFVMTSEPEKAISLLEERLPDILLLDLSMPSMSGFDILERVRAHERLRFTPVIILTAETASQAKLRALSLGATDFLTKPVDPSELELRLRNAIALKAYQDRLADFDALTELPNRRKFLGEVSAALSSVRACALLHIDLDDFKRINEMLGQYAGDRLLCLVAKLIQSTLIEIQLQAGLGKAEAQITPTVARVGANGFGVLLRNVDSVRDADTVADVARRVLDALTQSLELDGHELFVTASVGIAMAPVDGHDGATLLKHAEMAMYQAKRSGRDCVHFYSVAMNARAKERLSLESQLRRAVEREELMLCYQPKVAVASGIITGAEALVRWNHSDLGFVPPAKFIPLAEELGLIVEIGRWVLRTACADLSGWAQKNLPPLSVSVNVSGIQFKQDDVLDIVRAALANNSGLPSERLVLELTETMLMENSRASIAMLHELKSVGIRLSVDDFGTGYSSLTYLSRFPIDELKIDRSFVTGVEDDCHSRAIVSAILALARELNLTTVAEGVETPAQLAFLRIRQCDEYQGFLCSPPVPAQTFEGLVRRALEVRQDRQLVRRELHAA